MVATISATEPVAGPHPPGAGALVIDEREGLAVTARHGNQRLHCRQREVRHRPCAAGACRCR
jgi:hypothetical protein